MSTVIDAAAELESRYQARASGDRELRKLQQEIDQSQISIQGIWDKARLEVELVRATESNARKQHAARAKWLRASVAHDLRLELGIPSIPGYESPLDKIRNQRRASKKKTKAKLKAANDPTTSEPQVR